MALLNSSGLLKKQRAMFPVIFETYPCFISGKLILKSSRILASFRILDSFLSNLRKYGLTSYIKIFDIFRRPCKVLSPKATRS